MEKKLNLLIDIGNTNTSIAVSRGKRVVKEYFIYTSKEDISPASLRRLLKKHLNSIQTVLIVSVVPKFLRILKKSLKQIVPEAEILIVGKDIKVPITNLYKSPQKVGRDRLVISYAASHLISKPVIVVDFGTAVTFDYVNRKGEYEGGLIFPGLRLALGSLIGYTAMLPEIRVKEVEGVIGKDTATSMNNGLVLGYSALCDGIIDKIKSEFGRKTVVVATGGDARLISEISKNIDLVYPDLISQGLRLMLD